MDGRPLTEIGVSTLIFFACAVFWFQAYSLPPGSFEPLGSGPVPMYTAAIVMICCVIVAVGGIRKFRRGPGIATALEAELSEGSPMAAAWLVGTTLLYAVALHMRVASFGLITLVYLAVLIWALQTFRLRALAPSLITAAVAAFGAEYLFTNVFYVDLPT